MAVSIRPAMYAAILGAVLAPGLTPGPTPGVAAAAERDAAPETDTGAAARAARRTPVVDVFERSRGTVVTIKVLRIEGRRKVQRSGPIRVR